MKKFTLLVAAALSVFAANAIESVDELVGSYKVSQTGSYGTTADNWSDYTEAFKTTIAKSGDNTITIKNFANTGATFSGTVDITAGTITVAATAASYYTYCGAPDEFGTDGYGKGLADVTKPIVGTINSDGTLTFYYVVSYKYGEEELIYMIQTDTYTVAVIPEWTANGHYAYYLHNESDEQYDSRENYSSEISFGGEGTLSKYSDDDAKELGYQYELEILGSYIKFNVDGDIVMLAENPFYDSYEMNGDYFYYLDGSYADKYYFNPEDIGCMFTSDGSTGGMLWGYCEHMPNYNDESNYTEGILEFAWGALDAISTVKADKDDENAPTFDIMGRKVTDTTAPGIYIKNGKKFVVF